MRDNDYYEDELMQELNELYRDAPLEEDILRQRRRKLIIRILTLTIALLFIISIVGGALRIFSFPSIAFILESWELSRDPAVRELRSAVVEVSIVREEESAYLESRGKGSGFNIMPAGLIVTNRHLVEDARYVDVSFSGQGGRYRALSWHWHDYLDLAVIVIEGEDLPVVPLASSDRVYPGQKVTVIGNPLSLSKAVSRGEIREMEGPLVDIKASIHPGHSGSPVFNKDGDVIAVIFASYTSPDFEGERRGLAISGKMLHEFLDNLELLQN